MQTFCEAKGLLTDMYACFRLQSTRMHVTLLPKYINNIKAGITEQLNVQVGLYSQKLGGVIIAYNNIRLLNSRGHIIDDQPYLHFDVQADYIIFQPTVGGILKGCVNHVGKGHVGCLVHGCFNASIPQPWDSSDTWPGYNLVNEQEFLFEVDKTYTQNGILSMRGKLIDGSISPLTKAHKGVKRKRVSECVDPSSKQQCNSSMSQSTDTSRDMNENEECCETMAPPSAKKKKKHKHSKDTDLSSDSGIDFLPSPEGVMNASHSKHKKHRKSKVTNNNMVKDECFKDNGESIIEESCVANSHEQSSLASGSYSSVQESGGGDGSHQLTLSKTSMQTLESASAKKKHKKSKRIKSEPE